MLYQGKCFLPCVFQGRANEPAMIIQKDVSIMYFFVSSSFNGATYRNLYYFTPKIRVPLRATQAEAKRANVKK